VTARAGSVAAAVLALVALVLLLAAPVAGQETAAWPPDAEKRYEQARALAEAGRFAEAGVGYREVADWPSGGDFHERAQALYLAGLMLEDSRELERAIETYHEVDRRFPGSPFAARARDAAKRLEVGGARGLAFQRAYQAAWDVLYPATELARHERRTEARPGLERAADLFRAVLLEHGDDPRAKDAASALGDALFALGRLTEARDVYFEALVRSRGEAAKRDASELDKKDVIVKEERLYDCDRAILRERLCLGAVIALAAIAVGTLATRPWRRWTKARTKLALLLGAGTAALAGIAALVTDTIIAHEDVHEIVLAHGLPLKAAGLVLVPGLLGVAVVLSSTAGARGLVGSLLGAVLGIVTAGAAATVFLYGFGLLPFISFGLF
jgi:tetratricopeptide (TPR) repeat protein